MQKKLVILWACLLVLLMPMSLLAQDTASTCNSDRAAARAGRKALQLESSGVTRSYLLYVPRSYDPTVPTPLILSFHGRSSNGLEQSFLSNWKKIADEEGLIVAYPTALGTPTQWNTVIPVGNRVNEDLVFINDLIDALSEQFCIDPARIYANGMSNGGGMSNFLGCALSDRIAAIGGVSGAYIGTERQCDPPRAVPVIAFHGTADKVVTYEGGASEAFNYPFPSVPDWAAEWAAHNGCDDTPIDIPAPGDASGVHYTNCDDNADVIFYTIDGGGHTWPGSFPLPGFGKTSTDIDATATMWAFFVAHPMPAQQ